LRNLVATKEIGFQELEKYYFRVEMPKVRQRIAEFKEEMGGGGKCRRLDYLYDKLIALDIELIDRNREYKRAIEQDGPYIERALIAYPIPEIEKKIKRLEHEIGFVVKGSQGKNNRISPEMIEQAREYPIENMIEVKKGMALCPFHDDRNPSMSIRNNLFHCFGCGEKGDAIDFVMKRQGLSFTEAVKTLHS
jgi:hypothetical protein